MIVSGINYKKTLVQLQHATPLVVSEIAGRTCYGSFEKSEHENVRGFQFEPIDEIEHSELLDSLAWVHFHHSVLEHINISFYVRGTSRGTLQEHARHRIQSISVKSTRYTMSSIINAFVASCNKKCISPNLDFFISKILSLDMFVTTCREYNIIEIKSIYDKLVYQLNKLGREEFIKTSIAKSSFMFIKEHENNSEKLFQALEQGKKKRNVGDAFKHIVGDNWKVDMVITFNLRSLKNYFSLRDSGAAYFQIRWLAEQMKKATPKKYLDLIVKEA